MIGSKTLATLTLLLAGLVSALAFGVLSPARLATRGWGTLFLVGCFAAVVGTLIFRFWRLGEKSRSYFRWATEDTPWEVAEGHFLGGERRRITLGENRGEAFDFGPRTQHAVCITVALLLSLACMDARALKLLSEFRRKLNAPSAAYCPEAVAPTTLAMDPNAPGCELVRRAFALGYTKDLGDCGAIEKAEEGAAPCTRRQRDEPVAHYAWRLLDGFWSHLRRSTEASTFHKLRSDFSQRFGRLSSLRGVQRQVLASAPHASHHIWTNLPDPGNGAFGAQSCGDRYRSLAHRPAPAASDKRASLVFEHIVGQLLFEGRYEPSAGFCREYHVHWGAPPNVCQRLATEPEKVLSEAGAVDQVKAALDRYRLSRELQDAGGPKQPLEPSSFLSFSCYFETDTPDRKTTPFSFDGAALTVEESRVLPAAPGAALDIDRYDAVAKLLVHGFHYGVLLSEAGLEQGSAGGLEAAFSGNDFLLTRLYGLESVDIYLEPGWLANRPDLLEVYPYQRHLKNYVEIFRRQYRRERGRL